MAAEICFKILIITAVKPNDFSNSYGGVIFHENITIVQVNNSVDGIDALT